MISGTYVTSPTTSVPEEPWTTDLGRSAFRSVAFNKHEESMKPSENSPRSSSLFVCPALLLAAGLAAAVALPNRAGAQPGSVLFWDDFEHGSLNNWTTIGTSPLDISAPQNILPLGGLHSAYLNISGDKMCHDLHEEVAGGVVFTFYMYDSTATRAYGEARAYTGAGYGQGGLQNVYAIGKYNLVDPPENYDATKYQGRAWVGASSGWFNLNLPGAPSRSPGWHRFDIARTPTGNYAFYEQVSVLTAALRVGCSLLTLPERADKDSTCRASCALGILSQSAR